VHDPELIILDEPTNGLDPQGIADVRNLILHLSKEEGKTVFVSSHLLSEIEVLADSMLIIDKGKKVAEGKVSELLSPAHTLVEVQTTDDSNARTILLQSPWAGYLQATGKSITLKMHQKEVPDLASFLIGRGVSILSLRPKHSLEDYFLSLTTPGQHVPAYKN
jgi:ABC-type multidrug transport system ATPase subunit